MQVITTEDLFIFKLLSQKETTILLDILERYAAQISAGMPDSRLADELPTERLRAAFSYFSRRLRTEKPNIQIPEKQSDNIQKEASLETDPVNIKDPLASAITESMTSFKKAITAHCPWLATRYRPKNRHYNLFRRRPDETAALLRRLDSERFPDPVAPYLIAQLV